MPSYFITHPEVIIDPASPVEQWGLSPEGRRRAQRIGDCAWDDGVDRIAASTERKAMEAAAILAGHVGLPYETDADLRENDRSATGYLPPAQFEAAADEFFARPDESVRGWETATHAQARIVAAVRRLTVGRTGSTAFVAHGAVGALLYCHLVGAPISRAFDQPGQGSFFAFDARAWTADHPWRRIP